MANNNGKFAPEHRNPGDLILSDDWNAAMQEIVRLESVKVNRNDAMQEIVRLESAKVNREGAESLQGPLTIAEALSVSAIEPPTSTPLEIRGALKLAEGVAVNQFSADDSLGDNSDSIIPTQKAVKTYVDTVTTTLDTALKTYVDIVLSSPHCYPFIIAPLQGSAGMSLIVDGSADDNYVQLPDIGFDFPFYDVIYRGDIYISSNSYITFGLGNKEYTTFSYTEPGRALLIDSADRSYQRVYFKQDIPGKTCRIRFEGASGTSGTPGSPSLLWEATLFSNGTIQLVTGVIPGNGHNFISDGTGNYHTDYKSYANSSYVFLRQSSTQYTVQPGSYLSLIPSRCS